jgi:hypothetical protein
VKVLQPQELIDILKENYEKAMEKYKNVAEKV